MKDSDFQLDVVAVRLVKDFPIYSSVKISDPKSAIKAMGEVLKDLDREVLGIINLKADDTPINCHIASVGSLYASLAEPREMLKAAILSNAANMIMIHNHPSGDIMPSEPDIRITDRMAKVCSLIGIPLLDHVIVGGDNTRYFSFQEKGMVRYMSMLEYETDMEKIQLGRVAERSGGDGQEVYGRGTSDGKRR